jgi:multiple sugar transport system ATP-binding protein
VALGRAVVREPKAFLMDEPLSNLDAQLRVQMRAEIVQLQKRLGTTMIYVTHDQVEAMTMGDRIAVMRAGVLQQFGSPRELYEHPANLFVARFLGSPSMNVVPARVTDRGDGALLTADGLEMSLPRERARKIGGDGSVLVGLRPEHFAERADGGRGDGSVRLPVRLIESLGSECLVHLDGPGGAPVVARLGTDVHATPGQPLELAVEDRHVYLFDPETETALA